MSSVVLIERRHAGRAVQLDGRLGGQHGVELGVEHRVLLRLGHLVRVRVRVRARARARAGLGLGVGVDGAHVGGDDVRAEEDEDGRVEGLVPGQG